MDCVSCAAHRKTQTWPLSYPKQESQRKLPSHPCITRSPQGVTPAEEFPTPHARRMTHPNHPARFTTVGFVRDTATAPQVTFTRSYRNDLVLQYTDTTMISTKSTAYPSHPECLCRNLTPKEPYSNARSSPYQTSRSQHCTHSLPQIILFYGKF